MERFNSYTDTFRELAAIYALAIVLGAAVFAWAEGRSFDDALWWAFVTAMTVGYGDIAPVTLLGRIDAVILMHLVPLVIAPVIVTRLVTRLIGDRDRFSHEEQEQLKAELRALRELLEKRQAG
jgi:voltage-gated potassium channel